MTSAQTYPVATVPPSDSAASLGRRMLNKVPEITLYFLDHQDPLHHGRGDRRRQPERKPRPRSQRYQLRHGGAADRRPGLPVQGTEVRPGDLLAGRRPAQHRRHPDHRQPGRTGCGPADDEHHLHRRLGRDLCDLVRERAHALGPHDLHDPSRGVSVGDEDVASGADHQGAVDAALEAGEDCPRLGAKTRFSRRPVRLAGRSGRSRRTGGCRRAPAESKDRSIVCRSASQTASGPAAISIESSSTKGSRLAAVASMRSRLWK